MGRWYWATWEDDLVADLYRSLPSPWIGKRLSRSGRAVQIRALRISAAWPEHGRPAGMEDSRLEGAVAHYWRAWQQVLLDLLPHWRQTLTSDAISAVLSLQWREKVDRNGGCEARGQWRACPHLEECAVAEANGLPVLCERVSFGEWLEATAPREPETWTMPSISIMALA